MMPSRHRRFQGGHGEEGEATADAGSFWAWVDHAELRDSPDKWLDARGELTQWLQGHSVRIGVGERERPAFFAAVKHELKSLYGWTDSDFAVSDRGSLMEEFHQVLEEATGRHFGIEKKVSTQAWAYHMARQRMNRRE
ncbi:hypothetical protein ABZX74_07600 [Streptomyces olivaceoviridis]|uniref:hypothetical protein n=1 Tax=Streptomyces olivaceoviridis TaxID=1921 RepID=UPI0033A87324